MTISKLACRSQLSAGLEAQEVLSSKVAELEAFQAATSDVAQNISPMGSVPLTRQFLTQVCPQPCLQSSLKQQGYQTGIYRMNVSSASWWM